ncbi:hypothetical protein ACFWWC_36305 [Streptomyces sp. NPDC058642]|uniref:hypothetical protein n=1 Tax=Streptomyces sp. NPDC058642 TaxID=3346572 RepID=UPI00364F248A
MGSVRTFFIPAMAVAALFSVSGCSEDKPTAQATRTASPSELARYTAAPDPTTPMPSPTTTTPTECVKTTGMSGEELTDYLKELPSSSGAYRSRGLTLDSSGLNFTPEAIQRPCKAVTVKLARYWVEVEKTREESAVTPARYEYQYAPISVVSVKVGPKDGRVPDTAPPGGSDCQGSLSVVYVGEDIPQSHLPFDLELTYATAPAEIEVAGDGVLSALYVSPMSVVSC